MLVDWLKTLRWDMGEGAGGMEHFSHSCAVNVMQAHTLLGNQLYRTTVSPKMVPWTFWNSVKCRHEALAPQLT